MAEFPSPQTAPDNMNPPVTAALIVYGLFALAGAVSLMSAGLSVAPLFGLVGFVGLVIAYVKRDDAQGTWVASHFNWLLRTFWWALGWTLVGWAVMLVLGWVLIGIPIAIAIWFAALVWILYRLIRGYLLFMDSKPVPGF